MMRASTVWLILSSALVLFLLYCAGRLLIHPGKSALPFRLEAAWQGGFPSPGIHRRREQKAVKSNLDEDQSLCLLTYASRGDVDGMREAIKQGADVNYCEPGYGRVTPLMHAAKSGNIDAVKFLLDQPGINIYAVSKDNETARTYAALGSPIDRLLASKGLRP